MAKAHTQTCPVAAALNIVGDHWTLLIIRDMILYGKKTYSDFINADEKSAFHLFTFCLTVVS